MRRKVLIIIAVLALLLIGGWIIFGPGYFARIDSFKECSNAGYPVSDTNPPTCNDGAKTFVGPLGTPEPPAVAYQTIDFQVLVEGDSQGSYPAKNQLITSQAAWQSFWVSVHRQLPATPNLIPVDFRKNDVIALTLGSKPTDGYTVRLLSLVNAGADFKADVQVRTPGKGCVLPTKATGPYYMAMVPKITGKLNFQVSTVTHDCHS
jgi:hypothetical protein